MFICSPSFHPLTPSLSIHLVQAGGWGLGGRLKQSGAFPGGDLQIHHLISTAHQHPASQKSCLTSPDPNLLWRSRWAGRRPASGEVQEFGSGQAHGQGKASLLLQGLKPADFGKLELSLISQVWFSFVSP